MAMAETLNDAGWRVCFQVSDETLAVMPRLQSWNVRTEEEAAVTAMPADADWAIFDRYDVEGDALQYAARHVVVIDDIPGRPLPVDVVINSSPVASTVDYAGRVRGDTKMLLGLQYAPIRRAFADLRPSGPKSSAEVSRVVISMGGTDGLNATSMVLGHVMGALPDAEVDVVLGAAAPHIAAVRALLPSRGRLLIDVENMAGVLASADLVIGAAGSSSWERCCLGLPSIALIQADNQRAVGRALASAGAALVLPDAAGLKGAIQRMAGESGLRTRLSAAGLALCDGDGSRRILLSLLSSEPTKAGRPTNLRLATQSDAPRILSWQSFPGARRFARNPVAPTQSEHSAWFARQMADRRSWLLIVEHEGKPAGFVRLARASAMAANAEVSILIDSNLHGRGVGGAALALARRLVPGWRLDAEVLDGNEASARLFQRAGYRSAGAGWFRSGPV